VKSPGSSPCLVSLHPKVAVGSGAHKQPTARAHKHPTRTVLIQGFRFKPAHITIKRGTKVRWINKDFATPKFAVATF
jgi:plastocyanin